MPVIQRLATGGARGFGLGVGGVGYSAVISESASISDSVNWGTPYQGNISEVAFGSDLIILENYWVSTLEESAPIRSYDITIDSSKNVYITGLGDTSAITNAVLIVKYNNFGVLQWQRMLEVATVTDIGRGITVDSSGNVYVAATYDDSSLTSSRIGVLVKYDSSGNLLFQSTYQPTSISSQTWAVTLDSSNNVYSVGKLGSSNNDLFIIKHNSSGAAQWMQGLSGGGSEDLGAAVVVDSFGNILVAGRYGVVISSTDYSFALLVKYDSSGTLLYQKRFTDTTAQRNTLYNGIALDSSNNIYCCGTAEYNTSGSDIIILSKFDSSATLLWTKGLYNTNINTFPDGWGVTVDSDDMVYIVGTAPNFSPDRIILAKYNSSGTLQWQKFIAVSGRDLANSTLRPSKIVTDNDSSIYITTSTESGSPTFSLILKLPKDGSLEGTYSVAGYSVTYSAGNYTETTLVYTVADATGTQSTKTLTTGSGTATSLTSTATSTTVYI